MGSRLSKGLFTLLLLISPLFGQDGNISHLAPGPPSVPIKPVIKSQALYLGWIPHKPRVLAQTIYDEQLQDLVKYNDDENALLYKFLYKALEDSKQLTSEEVSTKRLDSLNQGSVGSCVGYGTCRALDVLMAVNAYHRQQLHQIWLSRAHPNAIYAIGRKDNPGRYDGSTGSWSMEGLAKYGTLHRLKYSSFDLSLPIVAQDARTWANSGLPGDTLKDAAEHKLITFAQINTAAEAKAALQNGYSIIVCSGISYSTHRDENAFAKRTPQGWNHCLCCIAYRGPQSGKEGFLIGNSWGPSWNDGPIWPDDMPWGSFFITPEDLEVQLRAGDSYALSSYNGFARRKIKWEEVFDFNTKIKDEQ
mgnify:CR=1 FL=1